jgi:hypothetical protein
MTRQWWTSTWLVARREISDRGRARSFWVASVILLIGVACGAVIPALLHGGKSTVHIGIVGGNVAALSQTARTAGQISGVNVDVDVLQDVAAARSAVKSGRLDAAIIGDSYVLVKQQSVTGGSGPAQTLAQIGGLQKVYAQLPPAAAASLAKNGVALPIRSISPPGKSLAARITGLTVAILIYVIILTYGIRITIGVGEEKATRVVEVLLTTLRPVQLLAGKVIGMGLMALGQIAAMVGRLQRCAAAAGPADPRLHPDLHRHLRPHGQRLLPRAGLHPVHRTGDHAGAGRGRGRARLAGRGFGGHHAGLDRGDGAPGRDDLRPGDPADRQQAQGPPGTQVRGGVARARRRPAEAT